MTDERMTDEQLHERLSRAGARWREANAEAVAIDPAAVTAEDNTIEDAPAATPLPLLPEPAPKDRRRKRIWLGSAIGAAAAVVLAVVLAVQLVGGGSSGTHQPAAGGGTPLAGTDWQLSAMTGADGQAMTVARRVGLRFEDGDVNGNDGCNALGGKVTVSGSEITFGRISTTLMACLDQSTALTAQTQLIRAVMQDAVRYTISANTLTITKNGAGTLIYTAQPPATTNSGPSALTERTWQLTTVVLGDDIAQPYGGTASSAPAGAQLTFSDGTVSGSDGCNTFTARVTLGTGTIAVTGFENTTTNPCPSSSEWTLVLQQARTWTLAGDQLTVDGTHGGKLVFTRLAATAVPSASATSTS